MADPDPSGGFLANLRASRLSPGRKLRLVATNLARRFYPPPPKVCCGNDGQPGC